MRKHDDIHKFYEKVTFQLNDTHPTVAIAELMRVLMDDYYLTWEEAWEITTKTCAYTNHTIMAEGEMAHRTVLQTASENLSDRRGDQPQIRSGYPAEVQQCTRRGCTGEDPQDGHHL